MSNYRTATYEASSFYTELVRRVFVMVAFAEGRRSAGATKAQMNVHVVASNRRRTVCKEVVELTVFMHTGLINNGEGGQRRRVAPPRQGGY